MCLSKNEGSGNTRVMPVVLRAGALQLLFDNGTVRSIIFGSREIVRRIYMALRDRHWNTVPYTIDKVRIDRSDTAFTITFDARHDINGIVFTWSGGITGTADGTITMNMQGTAHSTFLRNRIGWCVLHPLALCKNIPCTIASADGSTGQALFPGAAIAPYQLFVNVQAITFPLDGGAACRIAYFGDQFETEDQRNWADASFKTYSTPLSLPFPVTVHAGDRIEQSITVSLSTTGAPPPAHTTPLRLEIEKLSAAMKPMPSIGIGSKQVAVLPVDTVTKTIAMLRFHHLRCAVSAPDELSESHFAKISAMCSTLGCPLEAAFFLSDNFSDEIDKATRLINALNIPISKFLVFNKGNKVTPPEMVRCAQAVFSSVAPDAAFFGGTDRYFVEINRSRPGYEPPAGICFSANPQVHTFDDCAIMENLEGLLECIPAAQQIAGRGPVAISPLTLRPRKLPENPEKTGGADLRQQQLFGAAWLTGALCASILADLNSLTCFAATDGPEGILSEDGMTFFPLYHIFSTGVLTASSCSAMFVGRPSPHCAALYFTKNNRSTLLLANLTDTTTDIDVAGFNGTCSAACLNGSSVGRAAQTANFWDSEMQTIGYRNGTMTISLSGYAVMRIDMPLPAL
jgi:hypothetical protein